MDFILKRKVYKHLLNWKENHAPDYALFVNGLMDPDTSAMFDHCVCFGGT